MPQDSDLVVSSYQDIVKSLFATFFENWIVAQSDPAAQKDAGDKFVNGVVAARTARDRALSLLPK
jgi:hypothetical protein